LTFEADPDLAFNSTADADLDTDPPFQNNADSCKSQIRNPVCKSVFNFSEFMNFRSTADSDADPPSQNNVDSCKSQIRNPLCKSVFNCSEFMNYDTVNVPRETVLFSHEVSDGVIPVSRVPLRQEHRVGEPHCHPACHSLQVKI
jgi:hypothetical protein